MSAKDIEKIINNTVFSLEMEGFDVEEAQKADWRALLQGEIDFDILLSRYIDSAKELGQKAYE